MTMMTTKLIVAADGSVSVADQLPEGEYVVQLDVPAPEPGTAAALLAFEFPQLDTGPWPVGATFGRDEIYGDDGR